MDHADAQRRRVAGGSWVARLLSLGAVVGPVVFKTAWLVLGFLSPGFTIWGTEIAPYSPISAAVSGLGLGPTAPYMNAAFIVGGVLVIAGSLGIFRALPALDQRTRRVGRVLVALAGLGLVMDGLFTLESMMLHLTGVVLGIGCLVIAYFLVGRALRRLSAWPTIGTWTLLASPLTLALAIIYFATFSPTPEGALTGVSGLIERVLLVEAMVPIAVLGWLTYRRQPS
jgi:hypothetical membrane protein